MMTVWRHIFFLAAVDTILYKSSICCQCSVVVYEIFYMPSCPSHCLSESSSNINVYNCI